MNLCDDCAYEFGECDGQPKFASEEGSDDRVIECDQHIHVDQMPTVDEVITEAAVGPGAAAEETEVAVGSITANEEGELKTEMRIEKVIPEARPDPNRFNQEEDFGKCSVCEQPLKRTALNRYQDAVRCVNVRCRSYRVVTQMISTGVK